MTSTKLPVTTISKFTLSTPLGAGGYGVVYKARHVDWGTVAFKRLHMELISGTEENCLVQEANIQFALNHPNIVRLFGVVLEPQNYGFILEFIEFGEMMDCFHKHKCRWIDKLIMIKGIVSGMYYLHSQTPPIIHGDLKIQNVLVGKDFKAKISDFGFSHCKEYSRSQSRERVPLGTVTHIPPEYWEWSHLRRVEQFDVYSFGILLWEIMTEKPPFSRAQWFLIKEWVTAGQRPDVKFISTKAPKQCVQLMKICWSQNPIRRPSFERIRELVDNENQEIPAQDMLEERSRPIFIPSMPYTVISSTNDDILMTRSTGYKCALLSVVVTLVSVFVIIMVCKDNIFK